MKVLWPLSTLSLWAKDKINHIEDKGNFYEQLFQLFRAKRSSNQPIIFNKIALILVNLAVFDSSEDNFIALLSSLVSLCKEPDFQEANMKLVSLFFRFLQEDEHLSYLEDNSLSYEKM